MKKFIYRFIIFVLPFVLLAYPVDIFLSHNLKKTNEYAGEIEVWNDIYNGNINADILIYGSSRAWTHINPTIIGDSLKMSSYNLGIDGHAFELQYFRHKEYLKHNRNPKVIILSLDIFGLDKKTELFNKNQFLPFMLWNTDIYKYTSTFKGYNWFDYNLPLIRFLCNQKATIHSLISIFKTNNKKFRTKGFKGKKQIWDGKFEKAKKQLGSYKANIDKYSFNLFEQFIQECKTKNIKLILVYTPEYIEGQKFIANRAEVISIYDSLARKYNINFIDYSNDEICTQKQNFYNATHLNYKGADIFTSKLVNDIKKSLQKIESPKR